MDEASSLPSPPSKDCADEERVYFTLGLATAPVIGVLLLLASTSIGGETLRNGIVGIQGVKPYDIMTLFISLVSLASLLATPIGGPLFSKVKADLLFPGIHIHLPRLHWSPSFPRFLGCTQGWNFREKAICLFLFVFLCVRCGCR